MERARPYLLRPRLGIVKWPLFTQGAHALPLMIRNACSDPNLRALCFHVCVKTDGAESRVLPRTYNDIGAESRSRPSPCRHGLNASSGTTLCGARELSLRHVHDRKGRAAAEDIVMTRIPRATTLPTQTKPRKSGFVLSQPPLLPPICPPPRHRSLTGLHPTRCYLHNGQRPAAPVLRPPRR